jgi:hypothetical protein
MSVLPKALVLSIVTLGLLFLLGPVHSPTAKAQTPLSALGYLTPEEEVLGFYAALEARDFTDAYSFLSPAAQAEHPFAAWVDGYAMTQRIDAQTFAGPTPDSVSVELWASDGIAPRVHGYTGTWWLTRDSADQSWLLDQAQIRDGAPPTFPFASRPTAHCSPRNPEPAMATQCMYRLNRSVPVGATITVTALTPQPLASLMDVDCASTRGGLTCVPPPNPLRPFSVQLRCSPAELDDECPADASFTLNARSLNGGLLSQGVTISSLEDAPVPTFFVEPDPAVTFTTLVPPAPPRPSP